MLANSPVAKLRTGFAALKRLSLFLSYAESAAGDENPTWRRIGYPGPRRDTCGAAAVLPLATARAGRAHSCGRRGRWERCRRQRRRIRVRARRPRVVVSRSRRRVRSARLHATRVDDVRLYLDGALASSDDLGVAVLAGATLGGGTTVNWCTALRLPERIAQEWDERSGIAGLAAELLPHYAALESRLGVATASNHNANNRIILDGAHRLGLHAAETPRNAAAACGDGCGYCGFGCAYGNKRSGSAVFLPDLAGVGTIYANASADRIVTQGRRARGVVARQRNGAGESVAFEIEADLVVICAGALRTPGLLARSGIATRCSASGYFCIPSRRRSPNSIVQ